MKKILSLSTLALLLLNCTPKKENEKLPILGYREVVAKEVEGQKVIDTVYHTIADFQFVNQDSAVVTNETLAGKIYVADFFFTSCRTICPVMKTQMLRVYEAIQDMPDEIGRASCRERVEKPVVGGALKKRKRER